MGVNKKTVERKRAREVIAFLCKIMFLHSRVVDSGYGLVGAVT